MAQSDGSVIIDIEGNVEKFKSALGKLGSVASAAISGTVAAVGGLGAAAIKVGSDFESSMSQVAATMGMTAAEVNSGNKAFEMLSDAAIEAGDTTAFSASEAADALNYLALAGYDAQTAADALPAVLNLAAAGGLDLAYASDLATDAMSALGIEASKENLTHFGDQMAKTASKANTSVGQLGEAILTVGGTAKGLAGGTVELNAALGVLANRGIKGAEGGTALRNVILSLSAPTDKAAKLMSSLGVEAYDASGNLRPLNFIFRDLDEAMSGMSEGEKTQVLNEIFNKVDLKSAQALLAGCGDEFDNLSVAIEGSWMTMDSLSDSLSQSGIEIEDMKSNLEKLGVSASDFSYFLERSQGDAEDFAEGLWEAADAGVTYDDIINALGGDLGTLQTAFDNTTGAMQAMADEQINNLQGDLKMLSSALSTLGINLYKDMQEPLRAVAQEATEMVRQLSKAFAEGGLSGLVNEAGAVFANVLSQIAAQVPRSIDLAVQVIQSFLEGLVSNKDAIVQGAIDIVSALVFGILSVTGNILSAGAELILALGHGIADNAPELLQRGSEAVGNLVQGIIDGAPDFLSQAASLISEFANSLSESLPELVPKAVEMIDSLVESITSNLDQVIAAGLEVIVALGQGLIAALPELIETVPDIVINIADVINNNAPKLIAVGLQLIAQLALGLIQAIPTLIANIPKIIEAIVKAFTAFQWVSVGKNVITALGKGLKNAASSLSGVGKNILNAITEPIKNLPKSLADIAKNALNSMRTAFSNMPRSLSEIANNTLNAIRSALSGLPNTLMTIGKNALSAIVNAIQNLPQSLASLARNAVTGFVDTIKSMPGKAASAMKSLGNSIINAIKNIPKDVIEIGKNIVKGLINGIASGAADAINAVVDLAKKMVEKAKEALGIKSPSKVFAKEVGAWLPPGIGEGMKREMPQLSAEMQSELQSLVDDANITVASDVGSVSGQLALSSGLGFPTDDTPSTVTNDNGIVINLTYNGTSEPMDIKKISRQLGIETAREMRRRGIPAI